MFVQRVAIVMPDSQFVNPQSVRGRQWFRERIEQWDGTKEGAHRKFYPAVGIDVVRCFTVSGFAAYLINESDKNRRQSGDIYRLNAMAVDHDACTPEEVLAFYLGLALPPAAGKGDPGTEHWDEKQWAEYPAKRRKLENNQGIMPPPGALVFTGGAGGAIHALWPLRGERGKKQHNRYKALGKDLALALGTDASVADVTRVLRCPGFPHYRDKGISTGVMGRFSVHQQKPSYTLDELAASIGRLKGVTQRPQQRRTAPSKAVDFTKKDVLGALNSLPPRKSGGGDTNGGHTSYYKYAMGFCDAYRVLGLSRADTENALLEHSPDAEDHEVEDILKIVKQYYERPRREGEERIGYRTLFALAIAVGWNAPKQKTTEDELRRQVGKFADPSYNLATQCWLSRGEPAHHVELMHEQMHMSGYGKTTDKGHLVRWPKQAAVDAFKAVAMANSFHPVLDYLDSLLRRYEEGDLKPVDISDLAARYLRAPDALSNRMIACWLVGAVKRQRVPGCKHDWMLVIKGEQGCGKSMFLEVLAGREDGFYASGTETVNISKDGMMHLHGAWIHEVAELRTSGRELDGVKAFMTRTVDTFRAPYAAVQETHRRTSVFAATTNRDVFLTDNTGNRRFLVVETPSTFAAPINTELLEAERDGIWLGALLAERGGHPNWLNPEETRQAEQRNENYLPVDVDLERLEEVLERPSMPEEFTMDDLLGVMGRDKDGKPCPVSDGEKNRLPQKLGKLLRNLGYEKQENRRSGKRAKRWRKKGSDFPFDV